MEGKDEIKIGDIVKFVRSTEYTSYDEETINLYGFLALVFNINEEGGKKWYGCIYSKDSHCVAAEESYITKLTEWQISSLNLTEYFSQKDLDKFRGEREEDNVFYTVLKDYINGGVAITKLDTKKYMQKQVALSYQVGGSHYKNKAIQPVEYIVANKLNFLEGCIVKRITRHREKLGALDIAKIRQECDLILQLEYNTTFEEVMKKEE